MFLKVHPTAAGHMYQIALGAAGDHGFEGLDTGLKIQLFAVEGGGAIRAGWSDKSPGVNGEDGLAGGGHAAAGEFQCKFVTLGMQARQFVAGV